MSARWKKEPTFNIRKNGKTPLHKKIQNIFQIFILASLYISECFVNDLQAKDIADIKRELLHYSINQYIDERFEHSM